MQEPTVLRFHRKTSVNRLATAVAATRPAFLTASVLPVLAAGAYAFRLHGSISLTLLALATLTVALVHSGANVLNDYFDAASGNDAANEARVFPFSGGSRFIQNGVLTEPQTLALGSALLVAGGVLGLGIALLSQVRGELFAIGVFGVLLAVTYSSPPCLACRGFGDFVIGLCFGILPVAGTEILLTGSASAGSFWLGGVIACFVIAILWVNGIPDIAADRVSGKWTLPARLGETRAVRLLPLWFVAGFALLVASPLPSATWIALAAAIPAMLASRAAHNGHLAAAMPLTILTHASTCVLLIVGLMLAA